MATTQDYIDQLKIDKQNLVSMLNNMGVEASDSETFTSLAPKIGTIVTDPILQDKSIEITKNGTTNIVADDGYDGLNSVEVTTDIASSGETPEIGLVPTEWGSDGKIISGNFYGTTIPNDYFRGGTNNFSGSLTNVNFMDDITSIGQYGFAYHQYINLKTIPDGVTYIDVNVFNSCSGLKQLSMKNVTWIAGNYNYQCAFSACSNLKAVWLGSAFTGAGRYAFYNCTSLTKIYIDLPRATVETLSNYTYVWSSINNSTQRLQTSAIICNDEEGFMTKEEFDAIDWSTYTG